MTSLPDIPQEELFHRQSVHLQVAEVEAQHTGLQGAIVVVLQSMMAKERSLREELAQLASELGADTCPQGDAQGQPSASCPAEAPARQRLCRPRKCTTPNTLAAGAQPPGLKAAAGCCWQGLEEPVQDGQAARSVAQRLQQLSGASASSERAASEVMEMLFPVPSIREINTALASSNCSQAEADMSESLSRRASWLHDAHLRNARCAAPQPCQRHHEENV